MYLRIIKNPKVSITYDAEGLRISKTVNGDKLTKEQIQQLKDKSLSKEERIEVAVLLLNERYTFEEVLEQLEAGKTVADLTKQESE